MADTPHRTGLDLKIITNNLDEKAAVDSDEEEIVLAKQALFAAQRSSILKIHPKSSSSTLSLLFHPLHHPRSLWTLSTSSVPPSIVWAIFDSHEHAISALQALRSPLAEPALESDLHPYKKLSKVDMKAWCARWLPEQQQGLHNVEDVLVSSPAQYSPDGSTGTSTSVGSSAYSASPTDSQAIVANVEDALTPIPAPVLPTPAPAHNEDHTTPTPPSCAPVPTAVSTTYNTGGTSPSRAREHDFVARDADQITTTTITSAHSGGVAGSEINLSGSCRKPHHIDVDGGVGSFGGTTVAPPSAGASCRIIAVAEECSPVVGFSRNGNYTTREGFLPRIVASSTAATAPSGSESRNSTSSSCASSHQIERDLPLKQNSRPTLIPFTDEPQGINNASSPRTVVQLSTSSSRVHQDDSDQVGVTTVNLSPTTTSAAPAKPTSPEKSHPYRFTSSGTDRPLANASTEPAMRIAYYGPVKSLLDDSIPKPDSIATKGNQPSLFAFNNDLPPETSFSPLSFVPSRIDSRPRRGEERSCQPGTTAERASRKNNEDAVDHKRDREEQVRVMTASTEMSRSSMTTPANRQDPPHSSVAGGLKSSSSSSAANAATTTSPAGVTSLGNRFSPRPLVPPDSHHRRQGPNNEDEGAPIVGGGEAPNVIGARTSFNEELPHGFVGPRHLTHNNFAHQHQPQLLPPLQTTVYSRVHVQKPILSREELGLTHNSTTMPTFLQERRDDPFVVSTRLHSQLVSQMQSNRSPHLSSFTSNSSHATPYGDTMTDGLLTSASALGSAPPPPLPPPSAFRSGDWICTVPACNTHNFGRNIVCILCGSARPNDTTATAASASTFSMRMGMGHHQQHDEERGTFSSSAYSVNGGASSRLGGAPGASTTPAGDLTANNVLVQALGGMGEVAAIQEAIKAHQSHQQMHTSREGGGRSMTTTAGSNVHALLAAAQRRVRESTTYTPASSGQLLIPTTLGNSPPPNSGVVGPTSLGSVIMQQNHMGAARTGDSRSSATNPAASTRLHTSNLNMHPQPQPQPPSSTLSPTSSSSPYLMQQNHHHIAPHAHHQLLSSFLPSTPAAAAATAASMPQTKVPSLLTPSGRKFAAGGRVQNISRDELNPILMFWPDNEPMPSPSQIRPPTAVLMALGGVQGPPPPILNTGNKGPIDAQPGDWTCGKCDYLNWRRRRVCANCFPHAEGNTEGTKHSTSEVQERVALLASVLMQQQQQQQQQQQAQAQQQQQQQFHSQHVEFGQNAFAPASQGMRLPGMMGPSFVEPRRHDSLPASGLDQIPLQVLARRYAYAIPPSSVARRLDSTFIEQPTPLNLPPRMIHPSASDTMLARNFVDPLDRPALPPSFQPPRMGGNAKWDAFPRQSPPSSRSSFSLGSDGSFYHNSNEPTPSPLPLLPAFLQEVVGDASESSSSSVHESPSPPSPASQSSAYGSVYPGDPRVNDLAGAGMTVRRRDRSSPAGPPPISNNIRRSSSHSSIWSLGYPGDRKEDGIRHV